MLMRKYWFSHSPPVLVLALVHLLRGVGYTKDDDTSVASLLVAAWARLCKYRSHSPEIQDSPFWC